MAFLSATLRHFIRLQSHVLPEQCAPRRRHRRGLRLLLLDLGEVWVVTCADGYIAAGDTETRMTCVFDQNCRACRWRFDSFTQVEAVRPQHTHAFFHSESRLPEHSLRGVLHRQLLMRQCSDFRDGGCHCSDWQFRRSMTQFFRIPLAKH